MDRLKHIFVGDSISIEDLGKKYLGHKWNKYIDQRRHLLSSQFNFKTKPNVDWDFSDNSRLVSENSKTIGKYLLEDCESLALDISLVPIQNSSNKVNPYKDMNVFNGDNVVCYLDNGAVLTGDGIPITDKSNGFRSSRKPFTNNHNLALAYSIAVSGFEDITREEDKIFLAFCLTFCVVRLCEEEDLAKKEYYNEKTKELMKMFRGRYDKR